MTRDTLREALSDEVIERIYRAGIGILIKSGPEGAEATARMREALLTALASEDQRAGQNVEPRVGPKCINCGEAKDGGYCTDEGEVGSFCSMCWDILERQFADQRAGQTCATWQPIETAPKDRRILLGNAETDERAGHSVVGYWDEGDCDGPDTIGYDPGWLDVECDVYRPGRSFGALKSRYKPIQPTHWQPLPAPPETRSQEP